MLSSANATALKNSISGDAPLAADVAATDWPKLAALYNQLAAGPVLIWKPKVPQGDIFSAIPYADFIALVTGAQIAVQCLLSGDFVDATNAGVRGWFSGIFAGKPATISALSAAAQRSATKYEALVTAGAGVCADFGRVLTGDDVRQAMGS